MEKFKKYKNYLLAFIVPFLICILIFYIKGVLSDIEEIFVSDLRNQHIIFLNYLKNVMLGKSNIAYSFYAGMGSSMISTLIFYCLSPINLLLLIVKDIRYAIIFIYIVKVSLASLTMYIFLKNKMNQDNYMTILFSTCYALGSFALNYFFCVFWFDTLYLAPLVMLGIDKIIKNEKFNYIYIFSLGLAIICNIQMGFGLCIYSVIYFVYSNYINYSIKKNFKKFKQLLFIFLISSLCAGAISSGALLGFGFEYANISIARELEITTEAGVANLGTILENLLTVGNLRANYYNNYEPFIYCGLIVSFFSVLYFFNSNIEKKKKYGALGVILIFLISFFIKNINLFWHLSSPVLLNFRYTCYLSLFLTMISYECYLKKHQLTNKDIKVLSFLIAIGIFICSVYTTRIHVLWTFLFYILIYSGVFLAKNKSKKFEIILIILVMSEIVMNGYLSIYTSSQLPFNKNISYDNLKKVASLNNFSDNYRVTYNYTYTDYMGDAALINQNSSLRYFSSVINGNLLKFFSRNITSIGNNNYRLSAYDSPLLLSLLGNKYIYLTEELNNSIYKKKATYEIDSYDSISKKKIPQNVYLYENPYALSLGYIIEKDVSYSDDMGLIDYQNKLIKSFSGIKKNVVLPLEAEMYYNENYCEPDKYNICITYKINNPTGNPLINVYSVFEKYSLQNQGKVFIDVNIPILINSHEEQVDLTLQHNGAPEDSQFFLSTTYNKKNLIDSLNKLQENMLTDIKIDGDTLVGKINSSKSGILFLSIPYDKNFKISVDGNLVDYYPLLDNSFIGLDLKKGEHDIKIEYVDKKIKWYLISTIISIIITIFLVLFINKKITKRKEKEVEKEKRKLKKSVSTKKNKKQTIKDKKNKHAK